MDLQDMEKHVTIVGALHIGFAALGLLIGLIVFLAVVGGGLLSGDETAIAITSFVGSVIALLFVLLSLPGIVGGIGLLRWQPWARIVTLISAVIHLMNIPIGTAFGVYTLWVLMQDETIRLLEERR